MLLVVATLSTFVAATQALVARDASCNFTLTASGGISGVLAQLPDGQNRVGSKDLTTGSYTIGANGIIYDGQGRGCILTPPTTQFQCDTGAAPTPGFSVGCDGTLYYQGISTFFACQTGDNGENIYTKSDLGQTGCVEITLKASDCYSPCPAPPPKQCQMLPDKFEFPHLIIPISKSNPDKAYGTSGAGQVSTDLSSIFNFDIPASDFGKTCDLVFLFPTQSQLQTASYRFSGDGKVNFRMLSGVASLSTTYANAPQADANNPLDGTFTLAPGNDYPIASIPCPAGTIISVEMSEAGSTDYAWFEDYNPCPIGLYITVK